MRTAAKIIRHDEHRLSPTTHLPTMTYGRGPPARLATVNLARGSRGSIASAVAVRIWHMAASPQGGEVDSGRRGATVVPRRGRSMVGSQPVEQCGLDRTDAMHHQH